MGYIDHRTLLEYESFWDWFLTIRLPWAENGHLWWEPTFLTNELEFYILATLTFIHAYRHGWRYMWLWCAIMAHGFTVELVSYWLEPIDNFWHAQSTFMFFGQREPLQIILVYPSYLYIAATAVHRAGLTELTEACALGLLVIVLDVPYDVMGIKLLWWTWHDTDANIRDRHYWVPWTSYYFHMTFACAFSLIYNKARRYFVGLSGTGSWIDLQKNPYSRQRQAENFWGEFKAMMCAGLFSMPFGICQFVPGYHWGADIFRLHAEFTTTMLVAIYGVVLLYGLTRCKPMNLIEIGEREEKRGSKKFGNGRWYKDEIFIAVLVHFCHYMALVTFANPKSFQVLGLHQTMGSPPGSNDKWACDQMHNLTYPYPFTPGFRQFETMLSLPNGTIPSIFTNGFENVTVWKRPYLCENEVLLGEGVFGYHCEKAAEQNWIPGNQWFWICGTDWDNKSGDTSWWEYVFLIYGSSLIGINIYAILLAYPRTFFDLIRQRDFPRYYKTDNPVEIITKLEDSRINKQGRQEYKVKTAKFGGKYGYFAATDDSESIWLERSKLENDSVGPVYGEHGGQYGILHDTYGSSSKDRIRTFESRKHSLERLNLYNRNAKKNPDSLPGISYNFAFPMSVSRARSGRRSKSPAVRKKNAFCC